MGKMIKDSVIEEAVNVLVTLELGQKKESLELLKVIHKYGSLKYGEFSIEKTPFVWLVWFRTDVVQYPQFKGGSLLKVVPRNTIKGKNEEEFRENLQTILNAQKYTYI